MEGTIKAVRPKAGPKVQMTAGNEVTITVLSGGVEHDYDFAVKDTTVITKADGKAGKITDLSGGQRVAFDCSPFRTPRVGRVGFGPITSLTVKK